MQLTLIDWGVVLIYGVIALGLGLCFTKRAGLNLQEFFLSGRKLPWWLLGTSMVATTFSTDTPNLVTNMVRTGGVSQNWLWWAFLVTGMCTVFFYAKLWRRSGVLTDMGFYELRYSGRPAKFLRCFRAIYLGVFFNVMIMASVTLAMIKIAGVLMGLGKYPTVLICGTVTVIYAATAGLWGVVITDLLLFVVALAGSIAAAYYALQLPEVGGLSGLIENPLVSDKLSLIPNLSDWTEISAVLIVPLAVQWWSTWYPGAEPGGGGYIAQRMLAARNEGDAMRATLWFNVAHYAIRPWPWIIVALCSLIVYPDLDAIIARFPDLDPSLVKDDLAYPAMLVAMPHGLLGLVVASLAAAYMSTISTHLNWGASYIVNDVYRRFLSPNRSNDHYVNAARLSTVLLIILTALMALWLENALQAFQILLQIGAGTGLIFLLRWFWWRINAWSEIAAMSVSFLTAIYFQFLQSSYDMTSLHPSMMILIGVGITTIGWLVVTLVTPATDTATLQNFYDRIRPLGPGWRAAVRTHPSNDRESLSAAFLCWFLGCTVVYSALFAIGFLLYGQTIAASICFVFGGSATVALFKLLPYTGFTK